MQVVQVLVPVLILVAAAATVAVGHTPAAGALLLSADPIDEGLHGPADGTAVAVR